MQPQQKLLAKRNHIPEDQLIQLLKDKDRDAFTNLYDNYSSALYGVVFRIVNDESLAEDILQEVFVKIWKNIAFYDASKGRLFTWLINVTRNTAIDKYRSQEFRQQAKNQKIDDSVHQVNNLMSVSTKVDHIGLKETVSQLKPEYVQMIDLLYFKGYTHEEVAKEFNIPLGTVKTRIRSAIMQLRQKLEVDL